MFACVAFLFAFLPTGFQAKETTLVNVGYFCSEILSTCIRNAKSKSGELTIKVKLITGSQEEIVSHKHKFDLNLAMSPKALHLGQLISQNV